MISLARRNGRPLVIGHRGAAGLAPENTLDAFRAAVATGVDLVEFDVLALRGGELVVAHSNDLYEVSHGAHRGTVRDRSLRSLREICPEVPTLEEALAFFVDEAPDVGIHLDLKTPGKEVDIAALLRRFGVSERSFASSFSFRAARAISRSDSRVRVGITVPRGVLGITETGRGAPIARVGLDLVRQVMPLVVGPTLRLAHAGVLVLHHSVVTRHAVRRARAHGAPVVTWTVDDPRELVRVVDAGVDAVVTNDPRIFVSTLES